MEQFIISIIALAIIAAVVHFGGIVGIFSFLGLLFVAHVIHRIKCGYWLDE